MRPQKLCSHAIPIIRIMEGGWRSLPWRPKRFRIPATARQTKFELGPGEEKVVILVLGQADDPEHARRLISRYRSAETVEQALAQTREWWDEFLTTIQG